MIAWLAVAAAAEIASIAEPSYPAEWVPVAMLIVIAVVFAVGTLLLSELVGRSRRGPVKDAPYEAGIVPTGSAHRRFHVGYYVIALIFLLFDVEVVLLFPWAVIFGAHDAPGVPNPNRTGLMLAEMFVFLLILLVGYVYAWRRGVLRLD